MQTSDPSAVRQARATAVIVTYQSRNTVGASLAAARRAHHRGLLDCVVVDNASTDGTAEYVAREHPWVTLVQSENNLGFGRGCNLGFEHVNTPYLLLLNPDAVLECSAIETLVEFLQDHPDAGIAAPAALYDDGQPHNAGTMATPSALLGCQIGRHERAYPDRRPIQPGGAPFRTPWVCGAVMMIRSDLFRALGGFDERFFLYFEETDLCRRAAEQGAEIWAVGQAVARHTGSASAKAAGGELYASCIMEHYLRSRRQYLTKHFGWVRGWCTEMSLRSLEAMHRVRKRARQRRDKPIQA